MFNIKKKEKYYIRFVIKIQNSYRIIKTKRLNPLTKEITNKKQDTSIPIDTNVSTYNKGLKHYIYFDMNSGQLTFQSNDLPEFSKEILDLLGTQKAIKQMFLSINDINPYKFTFIHFFLLVFGCLLGYIINLFI